MDVLIIAAGIIVVLIAGLVQGTVGFGSGLVMVPALVLFLPPKVVVPLALVHGTLLNLILTLESRAHLQPKRTLPIIAGALIGLVPGLYLLLFLEPPILRILIGSVIIVTAGALLRGADLSVRRERAASIPIGFMSGLFQGSISMSGPPVILFLSGQKVKKGPFRANLVSYFLALNLITIPLFAWKGLLTEEVLLFALLLTPALLGGMAAGIVISRKVKERSFRALALIFISATGISALVGGLMSILGD